LGSIRASALEGIDLTIRRGELVSLVGPSGCGKSTLLNLIAGLDSYSAGEILVEGEPVRGPRRIGYVFQQDTLLPWRNVLTNAEFALEIAGVALKKRRDIATRWLHKLGLGAFSNHYPHQLSGGMRKRLQLASVLAVEPRILLMEEAGDRLFTFTRLPPGQWRSARTTNAIERLHEEFKRRIKPCCRRPILLRCCSGRCSPRGRSTCTKSTVGRRSP
jgi:ABC-type nitrate/sulfonate/bicarbonate transport system ATPase subunit